MSRPLLPLFQACAAAAIVAANVVAFGLSERLGAHPFWAAQVVWIGLAAGLALALLSPRAPRLLWGLAGLSLLAGAASARYGKQVFAASYAENALAGQFWHFGWMALAAGASALIALVVLRYTARGTQS
jgi:hypothetical protein